MPVEPNLPSIELPLRDGQTVEVRPIEPSDAAALVDFHSTLSDRTIYLRYFAAHPVLTPEEVSRLTTVDHDRREAYVALQDRRIVGVGRWDAIDRDTAEVAFVISDSYQNLGLGSVLFTLLAQAAAQHGIRYFRAEVLPQNRGMIRLLDTFGESIQRVSDGGEVTVTVKLPALGEGQLGNG